MFVFGPFMCPNSGAYGRLSCAPRHSVFEKILILSFNNFRLENLLFGSFMCPYSGAHGMASCAPRISVFETILVISFKIFNLNKLPFPFCVW